MRAGRWLAALGGLALAAGLAAPQAAVAQAGLAQPDGIDGAGSASRCKRRTVWASDRAA